MIETIKHRGPDDTGFYTDNGIGLANARLSIIDIEGGHQPIHNEDGTVHVTYNGEIYNFKELRQELESKGHRFYTKSDTEVIVHGYEEYGEAFPSRLNGMFAIALWDSTERKLMLARDRMGIKPLHYAVREDALLFASEMKAILQAPIDRVVDHNSLYAILNLAYIPGSGTLLKGIQKLPPSSYLVYENGTARIVQYWHIPTITPNVDQDSLVEKLRLTLGQAVLDQLVADVPVGCFLSGGLDTASIVAFGSKASNQPLKTFCMGFGEETDEFRDARLIAEHFGTDHHELMVDSSEALKLYPKMIWHMEAPKYNLYPWFVCELVHQHVKVCLSGNGGDELFGGYFARYQNCLRIQALAKNPLSPMFRIAGGLLQNVPRNVRVQNRFRVLRSLNDKTDEYLIVAGALSEDFNSSLFLENGKSGQILRTRYSAFFDDHDFLQGVMNAEMRTKLVDDLLAVDDSMSMAHSLELRVPLLDNRIVDLLSPIPWNMKYRQGTFGKLLLRKAVKDILPEESLRKPKWGFSVNVSSWFKGELGELVRQIVPESDVLKRLFSKSAINQLLAATDAAEERRRNQVLLWQLLGFHFWHRIFIDSERVDGKNLEVNLLAA
jgi:asparagine synthase (glutamine-hydrolysing)